MSHITFELLLEKYFFSKSLRPTTEWSYQKVVNSFEQYTPKLPHEISDQIVLEWRRYVLTDLRLEPRTWNNKVAHLRALFNFGMKKKLLKHEENPFNGSVVRAGIKKKKILTLGQMNSLYLLMKQYCERERDLPASHCFNTRNHAFYPSWFWLTLLDVLRYTGVRQNQLLHLRLCDINLDERSIELRIAGSKNHKEHHVPIVSALFPQLELLVNRALDAGAEPQDQLFNVGRFDLRRRDKYPLEMDQYPLRAFFRRLSKECRFTVSPHRFRHTIATHMMKSPDRNLQAVKKLLGHVSIQSTLEYIDENVDSLRDILEKELM